MFKWLKNKVEEIKAPYVSRVHKLSDCSIEFCDKNGNHLVTWFFNAILNEPWSIGRRVIGHTIDGYETAHKYLRECHDEGFVELQNGDLFPMQDVGICHMKRKVFNIDLMSNETWGVKTYIHD